MNALDIILFVVVTINILFAGIVFVHSRRESAVVLYALISFFASVWSLATLLMTSSMTSFPVFKIAFFMHYIGGNLAYFSFFLLAAYYPYRIFPSSLSILIGTINAGILFSVPTSFFFQSLAETGTLYQRIVFNEPGYLIFVLYLTFFFILGEIALIKKMLATESQERLRLRYIMLGTGTAGGLGIIFNLVFPYFGNFDFFAINPVFVTLALTGLGLYGLIKYKLFDVRVIATELLTIGLWIALFVQFLNTETLQGRIIEGLVLGMTVVFGIFLIRSVTREVEQREKLEVISKELQIANEELRKLDKQKSDFISIASHQLRTPLSVIKGYISLILEGTYGSLPNPIIEPLHRVEISNNRLIGLVNDLLDLSRIERGKMTYVFQEGSLLDIADEVFKEMGEAAKQKNLAFIFDRPKELIPNVSLDPKKIKDVFINIIDNALHYTEKGSITLSVEYLPEKNTVHVSVKDTGIGISPTEMAGLFKKFSRAESAKKLTSEGTGLGLYVAKLIIEDHKGTIWAESAGHGNGSLFIFELPVVKE